MKTSTLLFTLTWFLVACSPATDAPSSTRTPIETTESRLVADVVYTNGRIYTVNETQPWAEAVAIKDGAFIAVGSSSDVMAVQGNSTVVFDLNGQFAMPGLHDTHVHLESAYRSPMLEGAMLTFTPEQNTVEALQQALVEYANANPEVEVLFAEQLPMEIFPNQSPTKAFIDEVIPDRPVAMLTNTEHEAVLNSKALELNGITADTPDPEGGTIIRDPGTGEPTGFLKERAAGLWGWKYYPEPSREKQAEGALGVLKYLNSVGVTSIKQMHAKIPVATAVADLEKEEKLTMRIGLAWTYKGPLEPMPMEQQEQLITDRGTFDTELINPHYIKLSIDGNFGSTGFALEPYEVSGGTGIQAISLEDLTADLARFDAMGIGMTVHAMGDAAARRMLNAMDGAKGKNGELKARHQLAHASSIHPDDLPRLVELDLTPEFSPVLWDPNGMIDGVAENAGAERMNRLFPMRSVHESGGRVVIGSDGPLFWHDPLEAMEVAVTRQAVGGSERTNTVNEAIDLETAIKAFTINSAYLLDQEDKVGSIQVGKRADMIVLDQNLFEIPETQIGATHIQLTIFDGEIVFDASEDPVGEEAIEEEYGVELELDGEHGYRGTFSDQ